MLVPKEMNVATFSAALASGADPFDTAPEKKRITPKDCVIAMQIYGAPESRTQILERHHQVKQKNADKADKRYMKTMQFSEMYDKWKPDFIKMVQKYESRWDEHLGGTTLAKHRIFLKSSRAPLINSALYCAGPKEQELYREEVAQTKKTDIAEPVVAE